MDIKTFVMMGRPGSGKGKQTELLSQELGFKVFSSGKKVREIAAMDTPLGRRIAEISESGKLTPFWFASYLFENALIELPNEEGIIFEGACRTIEEAQLFDDVTELLGRDFRMLYLDVSEEEARTRTIKRKELEGRADDARMETRLAVYQAETAPAVEFFRTKGKLIEINGEQTPEEVFAEIKEKISHL